MPTRTRAASELQPSADDDDAVDSLVAEAVKQAKASEQELPPTTTTSQEDPDVEALVMDALQEPAASPFRSRDFVKLFLTNVAEFCGATLAKLSSLQFLYEATGSGVALGGLGFVMLLSMVPATLYGGVLADHVDRKRLVAACMAVASGISLALGVLAAAGACARTLIANPGAFPASHSTNITPTPSQACCAHGTSTSRPPASRWPAGSRARRVAR